MDQNTTTIITNVIILIAALGGAAIGALLSNRYSLGQENRRKKREIIEELYGLTLKVRAEVDKYALGDPYGVASDSLLRMVVLTDLYLQLLTPRVTEFSSKVNDFQKAKRSQYYAKEGTGSIWHPKEDNGYSTKGNTDEFDQAKESYVRSYDKLIESLQELAKGSNNII